MPRRSKELRAIRIEIAEIRERIEILKKEGTAVDPKLQAALDQCKTDVTALAAQNGGSTLNVQPIIDAVNQIDAIAKAALTGINPPPSAPTINSLSPTSGGMGSNVTISGSGFGATQGSSTVTFNGVSSTPSQWSDTSIVAAVPTSATSGPVVVTVNGTASNGSSFTVQ